MKVKFTNIVDVREWQNEAKLAGWTVIKNMDSDANCLFFDEKSRTVFETTPMGNELTKYSDYSKDIERVKHSLKTFITFKKRKKK